MSDQIICFYFCFFPQMCWSSRNSFTPFNSYWLYYFICNSAISSKYYLIPSCCNCLCPIKWTARKKNPIILSLNAASVPVCWRFGADTQWAAPSACCCVVGVFPRPHFVAFGFFWFLKVSKRRFLKAEMNKTQTLSPRLETSAPRCARLSIKPSSLIHRLIWVSLNSLITHSQIEDCNINSTQKCWGF